MSSILTNNGAMTALTTLRNTNSNLEDTQNMISTGKEVNNAKDDAAVWSISKIMESDVSAFDQISDSLNLGKATLSVASKAAEDITEYLTQIQEKVIAAQSGAYDNGTIQEDIDALVAQIETTVNAAQFNGKNIVENGGTDLVILASLNRDTAGAVTTESITVTAVDLSTTGDLADLLTIDVVGDPAAALALMDPLIDTAVDAAASFGSAAGRLDMQAEFVATLTDTLELGISSMVDADMEEASAKLSALQVQQELGVEALSIANEAPEAIMSLFR